MKSLIATCFSVLLLFTGCSTTPEPQLGATDLPSEFWGDWTHAIEDQPNRYSDTLVLLRTGSNDFPPSRYRLKYEFRENGQNRWMYLDPTDGHHFRNCTLDVSADAATVHIIDDQGAMVQYASFELLSVAQDRMTIRRLNFGE